MSGVLVRFPSPQLGYVRSWLPCIFFSGGVTVGNIGRQLAMVRLLFNDALSFCP